MITPATRSDLDALSNADRASFLSNLAASMWRMERDTEQKQWVVVADNSVIARYGFVRSDFPDAIEPTPPEWVDDPVPVAIVTPRQGRQALEADDLLNDVEAWIATQPRAVQIDYESATEWRRDWPLIEAARVAMEWTHERVDALFEAGATL